MQPEKDLSAAIQAKRREGIGVSTPSVIYFERYTFYFNYQLKHVETTLET